MQPIVFEFNDPDYNVDGIRMPFPDFTDIIPQVGDDVDFRANRSGVVTGYGTARVVRARHQFGIIRYYLDVIDFKATTHLI